MNHLEQYADNGIVLVRILKFFRMLLIKMAALERMRRQDKTTARKATTRPAKKAGKEQEEDGTQENENQQDNKLPLQSTPINAAESYSKFPASPLSTTDDAKLKNPTILENERQARIKKLQARATQDRIIAVEGLRKVFGISREEAKLMRTNICCSDFQPI